jgi:3-hydroxy-9,10-secoandrosta-1,3,5(10)-triene-9,17-dione monooxygenase reductase component
MSVAAMIERSFDSDRFREVVGHFPTGVAVVASTTGGRPYGMAVASFMSLSLDPPLVLFCAGKSSTSWPRIRRAGRFCVSVLSHEQRDTCKAFAQQSGDKFQNIDWFASPNGSPIIDGCLAWIECDISAVYPGGDHDVVVGHVTTLDASYDGQPLVFFRSGFGSFA